MSKINLQVKLTGQYAAAFELFKNRPVMSGISTNTQTLKEILRTLPEWKAAKEVAVPEPEPKPEPVPVPHPAPATTPEPDDEEYEKHVLH